MQLLRYLNRKIYILFTVSAFLLFFSNMVSAHTISSNMAVVKPNHPVTFTSALIFPAPGRGMYNAYIDYGDGTAQQTLAMNAMIPAGYSRTLYSSTHIYSKAGTYTVRVRTTAAPQAGNTPELPNPAIMTQQVSGLLVNRIQLYFENNRPEITLKRNQKAPELFVKIDFSGKGYLKGYWEIDGKRRAYVYKQLSRGPYVTFKYPAIPPIPTFNFGTHNVRFVITSPVMNIDFPFGIYFVTSDPKKDEPVVIKLVQPVEGEEVAYKSLTFKWEPEEKSSVYLVSIFSKTKEKRIFSAYTRQSKYKLRPDVFKIRMKSGEKYIWDVIGFNEQNEVTAESTPSAFSFNKEIAFLPGQILFVTEPTDQGEKTLQEVMQKYGFQILETYPINTLGLQVTKFYTDKDIFGIINELKQKKGVVIVQPNFIFQTMAEPMNELQSLRKKINIGPEIPFKGKGITVAVVDTGVDLMHQDLKDAILSHANCISGSKYQPEIHGTAVAGLIGARRNGFGIEGYAPESKIFALRACKQISQSLPVGECYSASIAKALDLAIQKGTQIINMSLGTNVEDNMISKLIYAGSKQGIIFVAPAGNNSETNELTFPASHPKVISVAGISEKGEFFPNAKIVEKSDFYLPYDNLFSTTPGNKHNFLSGTSLSSAVVSGLLALAYEKNKDMIIVRLPFFDGDMNKWVNKYLISKEIATQEKN